MKQVLVEQEVIEMENEEDIEMDDSSEKISQKDKSEKTLIDLPGVGPATIEKLETVGFHDLMAVAVATPGELIDATGMSQQAAKKIIAAARAAMKMGFESGAELLKKRSRVIKLSTSSKEFDKLVGGGFESGAIVECFGAYGSSKTQIDHQLSVNTQLLKDQKDPVAVFIDTENTFRPERIIQFAKGAGLDPDKVLKNIKVARAYNSDHQMLLAEKIESLIKEQ